MTPYQSAAKCSDSAAHALRHSTARPASDQRGTHRALYSRRRYKEESSPSQCSQQRAVAAHTHRATCTRHLTTARALGQVNALRGGADSGGRTVAESIRCFPSRASSSPDAAWPITNVLPRRTPGRRCSAAVRQSGRCSHYMKPASQQQHFRRRAAGATPPSQSPAPSHASPLAGQSLGLPPSPRRGGAAGRGHTGFTARSGGRRPAR